MMAGSSSSGSGEPSIAALGRPRPPDHSGLRATKSRVSPPSLS